jgi:hypothetical protein
MIENQNVKLLVQFVGIIYDAFVDNSLDSHFYIRDIGDDRANAMLLGVQVSAAPHAARDQNITINDVGKHLGVGMLGVLPKTTTAWVGFVVVMFATFVMTDFGESLAVDDFAIFNGKYDILFGTAKMLTDGFFIVGNKCNFHDLFS